MDWGTLVAVIVGGLLTAGTEWILHLRRRHEHRQDRRFAIYGAFLENIMVYPLMQAGEAEPFKEFVVEQLRRAARMRLLSPPTIDEALSDLSEAVEAHNARAVPMLKRPHHIRLQQIQDSWQELVDPAIRRLSEAMRRDIESWRGPRKERRQRLQALG